MLSASRPIRVERFDSALLRCLLVEVNRIDIDRELSKLRKELFNRPGGQPVVPPSQAGCPILFDRLSEWRRELAQVPLEAEPNTVGSVGPDSAGCHVRSPAGAARLLPARSSKRRPFPRGITRL